MTGAAWTAAASAALLAGALAQLHEVQAQRPGAAGGAAARAASQSEALIRTALGRHALAGLLAWAVVAAVSSPMKGAAAGLVAGAASVVRDRRAAGTRQRRCEDGVPALARALADALRGGASVRSALASATEDRSVPAELRRTVQRHGSSLELGAPLVDTLMALASGAGPAMRLLCGTIALHLEAGGALASELDRIAAAGDAGRKLEEERVAATAQARATVRVVAALPLLAMAGAQLASPGFLSAIAASPIALALLLIGLVLEVVAVVAARTIVGPAV